MKIEKVKIELLKLNPANPRLIKDDKFAQLVRSVRDFPQMLEIRPIVVNGKMEVLGGNMRLRACIEAGLLEVPIIRAELLTDDQQREFIIKDNVGYGEWDWGALANEWDATELADWGLEIPDLSEFSDKPKAQEDDYEIPEEIQTDIVPGDLFEIGPHRLLCGDSTNTESINTLIKGSIADIVFTSPPYNLGKSVRLRNGARKKFDSAYNDFEDNSGWADLMHGFLGKWLSACKYACVNVQLLTSNKFDLFSLVGKYAKNIIDVAVWSKINPPPAMAEKVMTSSFEFIFIFSLSEKNTRAINTASFKRGSFSNVYTSGIATGHDASIHGAVFPVHFPYHFIDAFTCTGALVYDPFLGSGTTMVAAHQLGRRCYGMEIDPKYCQVIVDRMLALAPDLEVKKNGQRYERTQATTDRG